MSAQSLGSNQQRPPDYSEAAADRVAGIILWIVFVVILGIVGYFYWVSHETTNLADFKFWSKDDSRWLEVIFWSFVAALISDLFGLSERIWESRFKKEFCLEFLVVPLLAPIVTTPFLLILFSVGISFGNLRIAFSEAGVHWMIALAMLGGFFYTETKRTAAQVSTGFREKVQRLLSTK